MVIQDDHLLCERHVCLLRMRICRVAGYRQMATPCRKQKVTYNFHVPSNLLQLI
jgi:hypothetical protein